MSTPSSDLGHGNSPAAWTAVVIMLLSVVVGAVAFYLEAPVVVFCAAGAVLVGLIVGWIMKAAGYGVNGSKLKKEH